MPQLRSLSANADRWPRHPPQNWNGALSWLKAASGRRSDTDVLAPSETQGDFPWPGGLSLRTWMAEDGIPEILAEQRLGHQLPGIRG